MVTAICEYCKELFTVLHNGQRYCNPRHRKIARGFRRDKGLLGEIKACAPVKAPLCSTDAGDVQLIQRAVRSWPEQALPVLPPELVDKFANIAINDLTKTKTAIAAAKVATSAFTAIHKIMLEHKKFERGDGAPGDNADIHNALKELINENPPTEQVRRSDNQGEIHSVPPHSTPGEGSPPTPTGQGPEGDSDRNECPAR